MDPLKSAAALWGPPSLVWHLRKVHIHQAFAANVLRLTIDLQLKGGCTMEKTIPVKLDFSYNKRRLRL